MKWICKVVQYIIVILVHLRSSAICINKTFWIWDCLKIKVRTELWNLGYVLSFTKAATEFCAISMWNHTSLLRIQANLKSDLCSPEIWQFWGSWVNVAWIVSLTQNLKPDLLMCDCHSDTQVRNNCSYAWRLAESQYWTSIFLPFPFQKPQNTVGKSLYLSE